MRSDWRIGSLSTWAEKVTQYNLVQYHKYCDLCVLLHCYEGTPWFDSGRWTSREPMHREAWLSTARAPEKRGVPFKLDDCRVWIRLQFWAVHDCGLGKHRAFMRWYAEFLGYFVQLYEVKAKDYVVEDSYWAAQPGVIDRYFKAGNKMEDIVGVE